MKWPESELYDLRAAVECDLHWSLVVTTAALSVGIPHTLRSRFRPGDPFVAEVFTVETPRGQTYLASRLQLPNGISGQVFDPFPVRYFAYGSNMDPQQMHERVSNARFIGRARLPGYRLAFTRVSTKWKAGVADVLADPNDEVWGVLYAMTKNDLHKLDRFEGYPTAYNRLEVDVGFDPDLEPVRAWAYVVAHPNVQTVPPPRRDYMRSIVDGARDAGLPESWLARLAAIETVD